MSGITPAAAPPIVPTDIEVNHNAERKRSLEHVETMDENELDEKPGRDVPRIEMTHADSVRIRKKLDKRVLPILVWVYFLQITDKLVMGYGNVYGLSTDIGLQGQQYSLAVTMNNIAQLAIMPISAYVIVKVPAKILMPVLCFSWGTAQACMASSTSFSTLAASRFFLGLFEAGCVPLFGVLTALWYRREEQPLRVCAWYSTNGVGQIVSAILSYALGKAQSDILKPWQSLFILVGLVTVITAPIVYFFLDSRIEDAKWLTEEEREMALERVRANQTGKGLSREFKWAHIWELAYDPKTYLFGMVAICINLGATVTTSFGPTLIRNFGFEKDISSLLNIPFGALQIITIWAGSIATQRWKLKGVLLCACAAPVLVGCGLLYYANNREGPVQQAPALAGYYLLAFLFAANPIIISWTVANTGGQTKKSAVLSVYNAFNATGSIIGPMLFNANDAPKYLPGIRAVLGVFSAMMVVVLSCFAMLFFLNKQRERQRVAVGKPAKIRDTSMTKRYETYGTEGGIGKNADLDLTDFKNDEFVYVY